MKKVLFVGDAACPSGFARATHEILKEIDYRQNGEYEVTVLGLNYRGDPHDHPYPIFAAAPGGDSFGIGRLIWMCDYVKPDLIIIQNDGWNIPMYMAQLARVPAYKAIPVIVAVAVDGKNFDGAWLKGVTHAIFWTQFALDEARQGGYLGPASVIPLGVDLNAYRVEHKMAARAKREVGLLGDSFIVGNVNRNQPRKRWDLTVKYFAEWIKGSGVQDAWLYLHTAPTGDTGIDVVRLAKYYGILDRLALMEPPVFYGISEDEMRDTYNCFDVLVSTTQGEGMGLPAMEAMACGVPCILPDWSAYGDWAREAAALIPCTSTAIGPPFINVIGGVVDQEQFTLELDRVYRDAAYRRDLARRGTARISEGQFRWPAIGAAYAQIAGQLVGQLAEVRA